MRLLAKTTPQDKSNGYEEAAESFMSTRNPHVGVATVREWSQTLAPSSSILDLGCGHGMPISQVLIEGFQRLRHRRITEVDLPISQTIS
jgi:hypothetical protein